MKQRKSKISLISAALTLAAGACVFFWPQAAARNGKTAAPASFFTTRQPGARRREIQPQLLPIVPPLQLRSQPFRLPPKLRRRLPFQRRLRLLPRRRRLCRPPRCPLRKVLFRKSRLRFPLILKNQPIRKPSTAENRSSRSDLRSAIPTTGAIFLRSASATGLGRTPRHSRSDSSSIMRKWAGAH